MCYIFGKQRMQGFKDDLFTKKFSQHFHKISRKFHEIFHDIFTISLRCSSINKSSIKKSSIKKSSIKKLNIKKSSIEKSKFESRESIDSDATYISDVVFGEMAHLGGKPFIT